MMKKLEEAVHRANCLPLVDSFFSQPPGVHSASDVNDLSPEGSSGVGEQGYTAKTRPGGYSVKVLLAL